MPAAERHRADKRKNASLLRLGGLIAAAIGVVLVGVVLIAIFGDTGKSSVVGSGRSTVVRLENADAVLSVLGVLVGYVGLGVLVVVACAFIDGIHAEQVRGDVRSVHPSRPAGRTIRAAARTLPPAVRNDYLEEWTAWMLDLHTNGVPWHRRLIEVVSIVLVAAPRLAAILRLHSRQAVDQ